MSILNLLLRIFLFYLLYKLIFDLIIPIYKSTTRIKKQFGEMQQKMNDEINRSQSQQNTPAPQPKASIDEEYIEFEEIKK